MERNTTEAPMGTLTPTVETSQGLFLRNEQGGIRSFIGIALAGAVALSACGAALGAPRKVGEWLGGLHVGTKVVDAKIEAEHLWSKPAQLACQSLSAWDASETAVPFQVMMGKRAIPSAHQTIVFKVKKDGKEQGTVVGMITCQDEAGAKVQPAVTMQETAPENGNKYVTTEHTINGSAITATPLFIYKNVGEVNGTGWNSAGALASGASAAANGFCQAGNFIKDKLGGSDDSKKCDAAAAKINDLVDQSAKSNQEYAERMILEAIQKQGSKAIWEKSTLPNFYDSTCMTAYQIGGAEAVKALRFKVLGEPTFAETVFDKYKNELPKNEVGNITVDKKSTKIVITEAADAVYKPRCYSTTIQGPDGLTQLVPAEAK